MKDDFRRFVAVHQTNMTKTCSKCGLSNPSEAAFCHNCATPLSAATQSPPKQSAWPQNPPGGPIAGGAGYVAAPASQRPMIAMILAIAAVLCCGPLLGVPAAILGWMELEAIKNGRAPESGKTMAAVGLWGGIAATVIHVGLWIIWVLLGAVSSVTY